MNYNLKNKAVAVIALAFVFTLTMSHASLAAEENAAAATENVVSAPVPAGSVDGLIQSTASAAEDASKTIDAAVDTANQAAEAVKDSVQDIQNGVENVQNNVQDAAAAAQGSLDALSLDEPAIAAPEAPIGSPSPVEAAPAGSPSGNDDGLDFLNNQSPDDFLSNSGPLIDAADMSDLSTDDVVKFDEPGENPLSNEAVSASYEEFKELDKEIDKSLPEADAPKSPLEKFGNAILSKVDNNLFNQMSHIEKEATLLQLEKKREELRTKVLEERQKSLAIIEATRRAKLQLEEERKRAEAERQAKILEEERKLREKEMELEKLRQGKVINDYMNEMLMMNQKWVEKSAKLQSRIKELENERVELIDNFKAKMTTIDEEIQKTHEHAVLVVNEHQKMIEEFNRKIEDLEGTINDLKHALKESRRKLRELQDANLSASSSTKAEDSDGPDKNDVDMSREYAIMDITGKGDDIVAKIINAEGKIFIVHKGSMLKNGEVVTSITDHYISFENKGVNSYLYTGNTVMEYEPEASFGDTADKISSKPKDSDSDEAEGTEAKNTKKSKNDDTKKQTKPVKVESSRTAKDTPKKPSVSQRVAPPPPGRGMFMK